MEKILIMDDLAIERSLKRITHEIIEHNKGVDNIILVGIRSRGVYLARRLAALIRSFEQVEIPVYALDVSFWRDDHKRTQSRSEAIQRTHHPRGDGRDHQLRPCQRDPACRARRPRSP